MSTNQKKLVEAFKTFFDKSIMPHMANNEGLVNEWKYFNNIISSDPIDYSQIQFYLLLSNKQSPNSPNYNNNKPPPQRQTTSNITDFNKFGKRSNQFSGVGLQKKSSLVNSTTGSKRKNLISNLQNFQNLLIRNQQKLQNFNKTNRETSFNTSITSNGTSKKFY